MYVFRKIDGNGPASMMTFSHKHKLSIVIVSFNTKNRLRKCLDSIYRNKRQIDLEIIICDNNSQDGSAEMIKGEFPSITLIENRENLGFSKGVNKGVLRSHGEYILLLNPDAEVLPNALEIMTGFMDKNIHAGICGSKLLNADGSLQATARNFPRPINAIFGRRSFLTALFPENRFSRAYMPCLDMESDEPAEVDWVSGASLMTRREVLQEVGLLDEHFFHYWEDCDFCYRVKKNSWKVFYVHKACVIHDEGHGGSETNTKLAARLIFEFHKGVYYFYKKHYIKSNLNPMKLMALVGLTFRALYLYFILLLKLLICS